MRHRWVRLSTRDLGVGDVTDRIVHSTATGQPRGDEGRDVIPTRDERVRPYSLDTPVSGGTLDRDIRLTPAILEYALRECERRGIKLSDCTIIDARTVRFP